MKIEDLWAESKNLSLVDKNSNEEDKTYQIWSSGSDDKEMCPPTHEAKSKNLSIPPLSLSLSFFSLLMFL